MKIERAEGGVDFPGCKQEKEKVRLEKTGTGGPQGTPTSTQKKGSRMCTLEGIPRLTASEPGRGTRGNTGKKLGETDARCLTTKEGSSLNGAAAGKKSPTAKPRGKKGDGNLIGEKKS